MTDTSYCFTPCACAWGDNNCSDGFTMYVWYSLIVKMIIVVLVINSVCQWRIHNCADMSCSSVITVAQTNFIWAYALEMTQSLGYTCVHKNS